MNLPAHKIKRFFKSIFLGIRPLNGLYLILAIGLLSIFFVPVLFTFDTFLPSFKDTGPIGDTVNGIAGPFIALTAAILTYFAFYMQYRANRLQLKQFKVQKKQFDKQISDQKEQFETQLNRQATTETFQRFENKYYELVRFHRANMDEMNIGDTVYARKCFIRMYDEFRLCFSICEDNYKLLNKDTRDEISNLTGFAYTIFFFGIGPISEKNYHFNPYELKLLHAVKSKLEEIQQIYFTRSLSLGRGYQQINFMLGKESISFDAYYYPFDGHISRLAHYYRHLFHTVKYVVKQSEELIPYETKLEYLQTLRAQLSNHEQVMLYYNAVAGYGDAWFQNNYFTNYKMIHNLPFDLCDFGIKPHDHQRIKDGIKYWEGKGSSLFEQDE